jgi:hypothetical protein
MMQPNTTREVLIVEALGEAAKLIRQVQALADAHSGLAGQLAAFEAHVLALTEKSKVVAVKHILARTEDAARQSAEVHSRAMADAARVAFGAEVGAALQRLKSLHERPERRWERWLTHAAAAATASAGTLMLTLTLWAR